MYNINIEEVKKNAVEWLVPRHFHLTNDSYEKNPENSKSD